MITSQWAQLEHLMGVQPLSQTRQGTVFWGDSITKGFKEICSGQPEERKNTCFNLGVNMDTWLSSSGRLWMFCTMKPSRVAINLGMNDVLTPVHVEVSVQHARLHLQVMKACSPEATIQLQSVPATEAPREEDVRPYNAAYRQLAEELQLPWCDIQGRMSALAQGQNLMVDSVHPNAFGYGLWQKVLDDCGWESLRRIPRERVRRPDALRRSHRRVFWGS